LLEAKTHKLRPPKKNVTGKDESARQSETQRLTNPENTCRFTHETIRMHFKKSLGDGKHPFRTKRFFTLSGTHKK
jgi:hypothetical protein